MTVQLDGGQFQEQSQEYVRWKEWRDKVAIELRQSVSMIAYSKVWKNSLRHFQLYVSENILYIITLTSQQNVCTKVSFF